MVVFYAKCFLLDGTLLWCSAPCSSYDNATAEMREAALILDCEGLVWVITDRDYEFEKEGGALGGSGRLPRL